MKQLTAGQPAIAPAEVLPPDPGWKPGAARAGRPEDTPGRARAAAALTRMVASGSVRIPDAVREFYAGPRGNKP